MVVCAVNMPAATVQILELCDNHPCPKKMGVTCAELGAKLQPEEEMLDWADVLMFKMIRAKQLGL